MAGFLSSSEYGSEVRGRIFESEAVRARAGKELSRDLVTSLFQLIPADRVMHYGDTGGIKGSPPLDSRVNTEGFLKIISLLRKLSEDKFEANRLGGCLYRGILGIAASAETPARLDNALGSLAGLEEYRKMIHLDSESMVRRGRFYKKGYKNIDFLEEAVGSFLSSRKKTADGLRCSVAFGKISDKIIHSFKSSMISQIKNWNLFGC